MIFYRDNSAWKPVFSTPVQKVQVLHEGKWTPVTPLSKLYADYEWRHFGGPFTIEKVTGSLGCSASTADNSYLCHFLGFKCRMAPLDAQKWSAAQQQQIREELCCSCTITLDPPFDDLKVEPEITVTAGEEYAELSIYQEFNLGEEILCTFSGQKWFTFPLLPYVYNWSSCTFQSENLYTHPMQHTGSQFNWNGEI